MRTNLARVVRYTFYWNGPSKHTEIVIFLSISANGGEAVSEYGYSFDPFDLPQMDPLLRLQLALALCRAGKWTESFEGLITVSSSFALALSKFDTTYISIILESWLHFRLLFSVYESLVSEEGGVVNDERSAVLTAQAMAAFSSGDRATCKAQLFKS